MKYDPKIHHRKSIRLKNYDYSQAGLYFITICTQNRAHLFGEIVDSISAHDPIVLNDAGEMINKIWHEIPNDFANTQLNEFVIMPNHIHGIIKITVADSISAPIPTTDSKRAEMDPKRAEMDSAPTGMGIPTIIQSFKRHTTIEYIKMVKQNILPSFDKKIWQRNYWEHIIHNENEYNRIAQYIIDNPKKWALDKLNGGTGNSVMEQSAPYNQEAWMI